MSITEAAMWHEATDRVSKNTVRVEVFPHPLTDGFRVSVELPNHSVKWVTWPWMTTREASAKLPTFAMKELLDWIGAEP